MLIGLALGTFGLLSRFAVRAEQKKMMKELGEGLWLLRQLWADYTDKKEQ